MTNPFAHLMAARGTPSPRYSVEAKTLRPPASHLLDYTPAVSTATVPLRTFGRVGRDSIRAERPVLADHTAS